MLAVFFFAFLLFCFVCFFLVSPVFVQYKLLFCKALSLVISLIGDNNKIDSFLLNVRNLLLIKIWCKSQYFEMPTMLRYCQPVNSGLIEKSKRKWLSCTKKPSCLLKCTQTCSFCLITSDLCMTTSDPLLPPPKCSHCTIPDTRGGLR